MRSLACFSFVCAAELSVATRHSLMDTGSAKREALLHVAGVLDATLIKRGRSSNGRAAVTARSILQEAATPGVKESLNDVLNTAIGEITDKVENPIMDAHNTAQQTITAAFEAFRDYADIALQHKEGADDADDAYYNCVEQEKTLLEKKEQADIALRFAQDAAVQPCALQEERRTVKSQPSAPSFECDLATSGDCDTQFANFELQSQKIAGDLEATVQAAEDEYNAAKLACENANADIEQADQDLTAAATAFSLQQDTCAGLYTTRQQSMCDFGAAMQDKCTTAHPQYESAVDAVKSPGTVESHPDRVEEWGTSQVTKCVLSAVVDTGSIDEAAVANCAPSVNYDEDVGQIDYHEDAVAALLTPEKLTCDNAQDISFRGETWTVPEPAVSSGYEVVPFAAQLSLEAGTVPFEFCTMEPPGKR